MNSSKTKFYKLLSNLNQLKWSITLKGVLCGVAAGFLAVLYRLGIDYGTETAINIYAYLKLHPVMILPWLLLAVIIGVLIAWMIKLEPMASGSGIPQVEGVVLYGLKMKWYLMLPIRFLGGILGSFFGLSLGREGPSIQIGAAGGQAVAKRLTKNKLEENYLITGGAAAGLATAFNAPLSGMVFALEEVHRSFSPLILVSATAASLTADVISKYFFGLKPVLSFSTLLQLPIKYYGWLIPIAIIAGLSGVIINKSLLIFDSMYKKLPWFFRPMIALMIALPCGLFLPEVLGGGQDLIYTAEIAESGISLLLLYFAFKILFTSTSFGSGIPGGIFMPILSVGALAGSILGIWATNFGLPAAYISVFAVCAMTGALSASVKAPVTSILLAAEMTGSLTHMLPIAACSFIALLVSDIFKVTPIYEALLERYMEKHSDVNPEQKKGGLIEVPVEFGCVVANKRISEVHWPPGVLVVGIKRGAKEFVPKGSTMIMPGDYLVVLSSDDVYRDMSQSVKELCFSESE